MAAEIRVRLYDVRFGDAILVTVPDETVAGDPVERHIVIDVGNVLSGGGGDDSVYASIMRDIVSTVGDQGVDLYVMTHEHMDHVQGPLHAATRVEPPVALRAASVWMTASSDPTYYETFTEAKKHLDAELAVYTALTRYLDDGDHDEALLALVDNNNPRKTSDCVDYIRDHVGPDGVEPHWVHRGFDTSNAHSFRTAQFEILAPEHDTSDYYGRFKPMALGSGAALAPNHQAEVQPPRGVDTSAFYNLVENRRRGVRSNAMAIDKARNNSSVVFTLSWRGRTLLFSGDAEIRSWRTMQREGVLGPVDFLKVSHHGSHNGTPADDIVELMLPEGVAADRIAAISTCKDTYNNVPDHHTSDRLGRRCTIVSTEEAPQGYVDVFLGDDGGSRIERTSPMPT